MTDAMSSGRRVLVTGGAGFIGSELVSQLAARGRRVVVVDNLVTGRAENLAGLSADHCRFVQSDIRDRAAMTTALADVGVVFHLACLGVRHSIHSPRENHDVNATATLDLLGLARAAGVDRFVHVSSSEIYGSARHVPMAEDHPLFPTTVYGASKLAGECYARAFHSTWGLETVVVRPFNSYGPRCHHEGDSGEVIPKFLLRCLTGHPLVVFGDGRQTRDFTYVADTARGILAAGDAADVAGETINVGSGRAVSINDLAALVGKVAERPDTSIVHDEPRPGDVQHLCADTVRARRMLRFESQVSLEEGLRHLLAWYRQQDRSPESLLEDDVVRNWEPPGVQR